MTGMRGLSVFISNIRNCQNKEAERLRVDKELEHIFTCFKNDKVRGYTSHSLHFGLSFVKRGLNVVGWLHTLLKENRLDDVMDKICTDVDEDSVEALLEIAVRCTDANPEDRPAMNQVVQLLEKEIMSPSSAIDYYDDSQSDYC